MLSPLPSSKWNYTAAAHLLNRAGFGGTPEEINKLVKLGPEKAVSYFVDYEKIPDPTPNPEWAKPDPNRGEKLKELRQSMEKSRAADMTDAERKEFAEKRQEIIRQEQRQQFMHIMEFRGAWLERMAKGPRPLQEKLTLFWHGHFATSVQKVKDAYFMWRQIQTFRNLASGNWLEMLDAVAKDPAMLIWLDQAQSRREHPNENFAREVMELFTLGEGHYTEKDVTEAARAMTGWTLNRVTQEYEYRPFMHDDREKTVLGKTGQLTGKDVLELIAAHPQSARFISAKLWKFFAAENPDPKLIDALAEVFRKNENNFKPLLRTIFRSQEFYSEAVIRTQVKSPVQWLISSIRMLERDLPPGVVSGQLLKSLGQDLLLPPNVKGWDGGLSWITTNNLLTRYNQAALLVMAENKMAAGGQGINRRIAERASQMANQMHAVDVSKIVSPEERRSKDTLIAALEKRFLQAKLKDRQRETLRDYLDSRGELDDHDVRHTIRLLMSTPEYQLT